MNLDTRLFYKFRIKLLNIIIVLYTKHDSKMEMLFLAVHEIKSTLYFEYWGWGRVGKEHK